MAGNKLEFTFGSWDDRHTLRYAGINDTIIVPPGNATDPEPTEGTAVNKYGWPLIQDVVPERAKKHYDTFYMVDAATAGVKYMCFDDSAERVIWRETEV